jgi:hypothetical protein
LFGQPGELSLQVADPSAEPAQFGAQALVRPADVAETSLSHDERSSSRPGDRARVQAACTAGGDGMEKAADGRKTRRVSAAG